MNDICSHHLTNSSHVDLFRAQEPAAQGKHQEGARRPAGSAEGGDSWQRRRWQGDSWSIQDGPDPHQDLGVWMIHIYIIIYIIYDYIYYVYIYVCICTCVYMYICINV